ncbi:retrotransposon gag protein [Cucumis melo var. makuwa]|uniref:Retrotransposon gag protein n=1 Tax=Cucumis melo var. makuwa TaxID=1194695 RepID=A0A5D3E7G6_CUCMM|nr:retrotransposon gag protein [Cucumis melo var. makuwa]TYK31636.1 retrotransposon gag protein [Cucumis melo var. makuwa]
MLKEPILKFARENKIELDIDEVAQASYVAVKMTSSVSPLTEFYDQRKSLIQYGTFEPILVRFQQKIMAMDSQNKEELDDGEEWIVGVRSSAWVFPILEGTVVISGFVFLKFKSFVVASSSTSSKALSSIVASSSSSLKALSFIDPPRGSSSSSSSSMCCSREDHHLHFQCVVAKRITIFIFILDVLQPKGSSSSMCCCQEDHCHLQCVVAKRNIIFNVL